MSLPNRNCAIYLAAAPDLRLVWANEAYLELLSEPYSQGAAIGRRLDEVSPMASFRSEVLLDVIRTGVPQEGQDRNFSVEDGTTLLDWRAYRPLPGHVLVVINTHPAVPRFDR